MVSGPRWDPSQSDLPQVLEPGLELPQRSALELSQHTALELLGTSRSNSTASPCQPSTGGLKFDRPRVHAPSTGVGLRPTSSAFPQRRPP